MYDLWWFLIYGVVMILLSAIDIKLKKIPILGISIVAGISIIFLWLSRTYRSIDIWTICLGLVPGILLVFISWVTSGKVGIGDGMLIAALGLGIGFEKCVYVLCVALFFSCILCGILLLIKKANRNTHIPFVPFITVGVGVVAIAYI